MDGLPIRECTSECHGMVGVSLNENCECTRDTVVSAESSYICSASVLRAFFCAGCGNLCSSCSLQLIMTNLSGMSLIFFTALLHATCTNGHIQCASCFNAFLASTFCFNTLLASVKTNPVDNGVHLGWFQLLFTEWSI